MLLLFMYYTSPLIPRKLVLLDVTAEQEVDFPEPALAEHLW